MLKRLVCSVALLAWCGLVQAQGPVKWVEGTHYQRLAQPQPTSTGSKVEVLDVFSYACPACNRFQPTLDKLVKALPPQAQMAYLPASFNPSEDWPVFQRAFLAAQQLGVAEKSHDAMYDAVWGKGSLAIVDQASGHLIPQDSQPKIEDVAKFYAAYGVKPADFVAMAKSFTIDSEMRAADASLMAHQVMSTPTIIVNGKYLVTPQTAGGYDQTVDLVLFLVNKEKGGK